MAQTIQLKRSAVQGSVPSTASLALGEIAINTYDGNMYIKKNNGAESIVHINAPVSNLDASVITTGTFNDARISVSNVTQHQASLSITESQISDLQDYVLTTELPGSSVLVRSSNDTLTNYNITGTVVVWDAPRISDANITANGANTQFTVGAAGDYEIVAQCVWNGTGGAIRTNVGLEVFVNGVSTGAVGAGAYIRDDSGHDESSALVHTIESLAANDVVEIRTIQFAAVGEVNILEAGDSRLIISKVGGVAQSITDADTLDGQHGAYYLDPANLSVGAIASGTTISTSQISDNGLLAFKANNEAITGVWTFSGVVQLDNDLTFENGNHAITYNDGNGSFNIRVANDSLETVTEDGYAFHDEWSQGGGWRQFNVSSASLLVGNAITWYTQLEYDVNSVYLRYQNNTKLQTTATGVAVTGNVTVDGANVLTDITGENIGSLANVSITTPSTDQQLKFDGTNWVNFTPTTGSFDTTANYTITGNWTFEAAPAFRLGDSVVTFGADVGATTLTDSSRKFARIGVPHYLNNEEPVAMIVVDSNGSDNYLTLGGGSTKVNAINILSLATASTDTTTIGTDRLVIGPTGDFDFKGNTVQNAVFKDGIVFEGGLTLKDPDFMGQLTVHRQHTSFAAGILFRNDTGDLGRAFFSDNTQGDFHIRPLGSSSESFRANGDGSIEADKVILEGASRQKMKLRNSTTGGYVGFNFSDHNTEVQQGDLDFTISDDQSFGGEAAFIFSGTESVTNVVANGGNLIATEDVIAYYSDERLKDFRGRISGATEKLSMLSGYYFTENAAAKALGFSKDRIQLGVSAQEVQRVFPEVVDIAPISYTDKTDEEYLTVHYDKLVPVLIESIKELQEQINRLKERTPWH